MDLDIQGYDAIEGKFDRQGVLADDQLSFVRGIIFIVHPLREPVRYMRFGARGNMTPGRWNSRSCLQAMLLPGRSGCEARGSCLQDLGRPDVTLDEADDSFSRMASGTNG